MSASTEPLPLTAVVITKNEAHQIKECIAALRFAPHVLVLDSESDDGTPEAARAAGADVALHPFTDYAGQRNAGLARVKTEWALMVDADERISPELAAEITRVLAMAEPGVAGYRIVRRNHFLGRPMKRSRCGRERLTRLMRASRSQYVNAVHETPVIDGDIRDLRAPMEHLTHLKLRDAFEKALRYALLWARDRHARGETTSIAAIAVHTVHRWFKIYIAKGAFLEGGRGFLLAGFESVGVFYKYALLWELQRRGR